VRVGSKGKGSRRRPGRDGGRRSSKTGGDAWRKRISHAVDLGELRKPTRPRLWFPSRFREPMADTAYRMDQAFAQASIHYAVNVPHGASYFDIFVSAEDVERTDAMLRRLIAAAT
jgi:hypothetical protein